MRPTWDEYFLEIARLTSKRSTCIRRQVGAVLVKDNRIVTTGYNGAPAGLKHCEEVGCIRGKGTSPPEKGMSYVEYPCRTECNHSSCSDGCKY